MNIKIDIKMLAISVVLGLLMFANTIVVNFGWRF